MVEKQMNFGCRMILDLGSEEQRTAYESGEWEGAAVRKCLELLPDAGIALDIGANVGLFTCALGMRLKPGGGRVHAFEPVPSNYERLIENVGLNGLDASVSCSRIALGSEPGKIEMRVAPGSPTNNAVGSNMLSVEDLCNVDEGDWGREWAEVLRLDDWAKEADLKGCDLMKIDVEGADLNVLVGGRKLLESFRPEILAEFNPYWMKQIGQSFDDVLEFFAPLDYEFFREIDGTFHPLTKELVATGLEVTSYLLRPRESLDENRGQPIR